MTRFFGLVVFFLAFFSAAAESQTGIPEKTLIDASSVHQKLEALFKENQLPTQVSILIQSAATGEVLFAKDSEKLLVPASVTKIATSLAVLHEFGPNHQFSTPIQFIGKRVGSVIQGDLVIRGVGDPLLTSELLWIAAADLKHLGIKKVTGKLLIDNNLFLDEPLDRIEGETDSSYAYDAPITAFGVNFNTFEVVVAPNLGAKLAHVATYPYSIEGVKIENRVQQNRSPQSSLNISRISPNKRGEREKIVARGQINEWRGLLKTHRSVFDPIRASGEMMKAFFANEGIEIQGPVSSIPAKTQVTATDTLLNIEGFPMHKIIQGLNHYSNNYIADVLTKDLGVAFAKSKNWPLQESGNFRDGVRYLEQFLKSEVGIQDPFHLKNGSGLSKDNRFSAQQVNAMLLWAYQRMQIMPEFMASLAIAGETGTLKKRFVDANTSKAKGLVRAKTGTLSQPVAVATLAGYFMSKKHGMIAFTILENSTKKSPITVAALRKRQDLIVATALEYL